jgi:hypothetical protein
MKCIYIKGNYIGTKQSFFTAQYVVMTLMFIIILAMFAAVFYGLFTYARYIGASNIGAVVAIFMFVSSCGATVERIKKNNKGNTNK